MSWPWWLVVLVLALALFGLYVSMTAGRLDRLHRRIDAASGALDVQLLQRSAVALELAGSGVLDPATSAVVADSAHAARLASGDEGHDPVERGLAESNLTRVLVEVFADPDEVDDLAQVPEVAALLDELATACRRVELSRRFLNDGVRACRQVRRQRLVRWLRLAGYAAWPITVEMDDTPPPGLSAAS